MASGRQLAVTPTRREGSRTTTPLTKHESANRHHPPPSSHPAGGTGHRRPRPATRQVDCVREGDETMDESPPLPPDLRGAAPLVREGVVTSR